MAGGDAGRPRSLGARIRTSAERTRGATDRVRYLGALLLPSNEVVFCIFDGRSAEAVEAVARRAKVPFDGSSRWSAFPQRLTRLAA